MKEILFPIAIQEVARVARAVMQVNIPGRYHAVEAAAEPAFEKHPRMGNQQYKPQEICEHAGNEQEDPAGENENAIKQLFGGDVTLCQGALDLPECT
jgi:hypothetical protein